MRGTKRLGLLVGAVILVLTGCTRQRLEPLQQVDVYGPSYGTVEARFCLQPALEYRQKLKYVFILDKSSSNQQQPGATDPEGFRRYAALDTFLRNASDDPGYTYYSLINFSDDASVVQNMTDDRTGFLGVVNREWNRNGPNQPRDLGFTNYLSALDSAIGLIDADVAAEKALSPDRPVTSVYVVVFITDGAPWIVDATSATGQRMQEYDPELRTKIDDLLAIRTDADTRAWVDDIVLHTGYYFEVKDPQAETLLGQMAVQANGSTYLFGAGLNIDFSLFAVPVRNVRHILSDVFVENTNASFWDDGRFLRDSDGDGLPDSVELELRSDPFRPDSDGNGVSDFVEYRTKGVPCRDGTCSADVTLRDNYAGCAGLMPPLKPDGSANDAFGTVYFADEDADGLNDCEEWVLRTERSEFDSNGDHVPDFVSLKARIPTLPGSASPLADPDSDGSSSYSELKAGTPTFVANSRILGLRSRSQDLVREDLTDSEDCFHLTVKNVALAGPDNRIRVYLVQSTAVIDHKKKVMKVAEATFSGLTRRVSLRGENFR